MVTVEYTLIAGINDQQEHARDLAELLRDLPCKINLIPFNTFAQSDYQRPSGNAVSRFWQVLVDAGYIVTVRTTRGDDIDAACGQLVGQVVDRTRRSERYRAAAETPVNTGGVDGVYSSNMNKVAIAGCCRSCWQACITTTEGGFTEEASPRRRWTAGGAGAAVHRRGQLGERQAQPATGLRYRPE